MKNNRTFKALTFTLAAAALSGAIACAACSNDTYLPDDPPYDFENPVEELPEIIDLPQPTFIYFKNLFLYHYRCDYQI